MGTSTDGIICYGIPFDEGYTFPWNNEEYDHEIEEWWIYKVNKYKEPFEWNYSGDRSKFEEEYNSPECTELRKHKDDFIKTIPEIPIEVVWHCSCEYSMFILSVKDTKLTANRGETILFKPNELTVSDEQKQELIDFCDKYCRPIDEEEYEYDVFPELKPEWYLCSWWC